MTPYIYKFVRFSLRFGQCKEYEHNASQRQGREQPKNVSPNLKKKKIEIAFCRTLTCEYAIECILFRCKIHLRPPALQLHLAVILVRSTAVPTQPQRTAPNNDLQPIPYALPPLVPGT